MGGLIAAHRKAQLNPLPKVVGAGLGRSTVEFTAHPVEDGSDYFAFGLEAVAFRHVQSNIQSAHDHKIPLWLQLLFIPAIQPYASKDLLSSMPTANLLKPFLKTAAIIVFTVGQPLHGF
jgi:hypothetical protein